MLTDAHCHPFDLLKYFPGAEEERRGLRVACAASAWNREQFECHETLARNAAAEGAPPVLLCFAVHPQLPAEMPEQVQASLLTLEDLAAGERLGALGETGFDLYDGRFRATEKAQEELFEEHLEIAFRRGLPLVLHLRRSMRKIFPFTKKLKALPGIIFHSWPGSLDEGNSLLRRGLNAYFSFGSGILTNHREAMRCAALFPPDRLLFETDAPWQPLRGRDYSAWSGLNAILQAAAELRGAAGSPCSTAPGLEAAAERNFFRAFAFQGAPAAVPGTAV